MKKTIQIMPFIIAAAFGFFFAKNLTQAIIGGAVILVILQLASSFIVKKIQT